MGVFGWSYPPGVTGNELEITGPSWEGTLDRACEKEDVSVFVVPREVARRIEQWQRDRKTDGEQTAVRALLWELIDGLVVEADMEQCPFEGKVDAWEYAMVRYWECPLCGTEHEEYPEDDC